MRGFTVQRRVYASVEVSAEVPNFLLRPRALITEHCATRQDLSVRADMTLNREIGRAVKNRTPVEKNPVGFSGTPQALSPPPRRLGHLEWIFRGSNDLDILAHSFIGVKRVDDENYLPGEV